MKRVIAIADRTALASLKLLVAVNILFFLGFFIIALLAAGKARAETPVCAGADMLLALQKDDPATYRKIETEAAAIPNGKGLLWKLERAGEKPSFLFGTMHVTDPRVTTLPPAAQRAFDAADTVVIETTEVLDQQKMMAAFLKEPELMMFTDSTTLSSLLSPDDAATVNKALDARGIPPASVAKMKPWMLSTMVALPACELARQSGGAPVLDIKLAEDARASGKTVDGLETVADQLRAMASLPLAFHMKGLVETLKLGDRMNDVNETMIVLYQHGDIGMFWPLFRAVLPGDEDDSAGYAAFEKTMITSRNKVMVDHAGPRQRFHGGRRPASSRDGRPGRGFPQGRLHRHCRRLVARLSCGSRKTWFRSMPSRIMHAASPRKKVEKARSGSIAASLRRKCARINDSGCKIALFSAFSIPSVKPVQRLRVDLC